HPWRGDGQLDGEARASSFAATVGVNAPAVKLDDVPHDRQPDPQPAVRTHAAGVGLAEAIEDVGQKLWIDARPVVADDDALVSFEPLAADLDAPAGIGE